MLSFHLIVSSFAVFNLSNAVGCGSAQACRKKFFTNTQMPRFSCQMRMGMGGNWEFLNGKMGMWVVKFLIGNEMGIEIGMKSLKWEWFGTKNLFPHIFTSEVRHSVAHRHRVTGIVLLGFFFTKTNTHRQFHDRRHTNPVTHALQTVDTQNCSWKNSLRSPYHNCFYQAAPICVPQDWNKINISSETVSK